MIEIRNLGYSYGNENVLENVNLYIPENTTCAVIGPSGCGKTTLLYLLAGILTPASGEIRIHNERLSDIRRSTGLILQDSGLLPWKTVWDNIALGLKARKFDEMILRERVCSMLQELDIEEHRDKFPDQLSGGQKQRVAIARTLVTEPDILLLDEASSALDAITKDYIQNLILKIFKKRPMAMVMVTHSVEEAVFLGQKIVIMQKAGIRSVMDNPHFGDDDIRWRPEYYKICLEVRKRLCEEEETNSETDHT